MCECIDAINEALAEHNTVLDVPLRIDLKTGAARRDRVEIATARLQPKKNVPRHCMIAQFCPFCGVEYPA